MAGLVPAIHVLSWIEDEGPRNKSGDDAEGVGTGAASGPWDAPYCSPWLMRQVTLTEAVNSKAAGGTIWTV